MTRKDTILIAVVINAGLLAILFATAVIYDEEEEMVQSEFVTPRIENLALSDKPPSKQSSNASPGDEVDNVLKYYHSSQEPSANTKIPSNIAFAEPITMQSSGIEEEEFSRADTPIAQSDEQERIVTVVRGDSLEKIAKANKTTIEALKRFNQLQSERLSIGQQLKIPTKTATLAMQSELKEVTKQEVTKQPQAKQEVNKTAKTETQPKEVIKSSKMDEPLYHIVKSGDSPWKIAKQYAVKYDDILRLNNLDEDKARNLKIGDRVRVK